MEWGRGNGWRPAQGRGLSALAVERRFTKRLFIKSPQARKTSLPTSSQEASLQSVGTFCVTVHLNSAIICLAINIDPLKSSPHPVNGCFDTTFPFFLFHCHG